jgi:iron complex outermembrane receptor protein
MMENMERVRRRVLGAPAQVSLGAVALALISVPATAQETTGETEEASATRVPEIVVTAQFREQALQDVPIAISAVNAEELEQRSVTSVLDVANSVPNVEMSSGGSGYGAQTNQAFIRGLGQIDFLTAFEPRVGFYVDDVYYATTYGSVFDVLDLERVEILRGPQGTLFGRNSVGGALRLISKKPRGDDSGYIEATAGSRSRYQLRAAYDLGISDTLALRVVGSARGQNGHVALLDYKCVYPQYGNDQVGGVGQGPVNRNSCKRGTLGGGDSYSFRGTLGWDATTDVQVYLSGDYTHERSESSAEVIIDTQSSRINPETGSIGGGRIPPAGPDTNGLATWLRGLGTTYYGFDVSTPEKLEAVVQSFQSPDGNSTFARYGN